MYKVNSNNNNASIDERRVDGLWDSHKNGRKKVVEMATGASLTRPVMEPSNSTPKEKFELPTPILAWFSYAWFNLFMLFVTSFAANWPSSSPYEFNAFVNPYILPKINAGVNKYLSAKLLTLCTFLRMINKIKNGT